ncbi:WD40 repeat-like protein [Macrolepiota fuliginosa MF-IS2]|uniref:WD40 repeat-like protein n=1 Tax=Macrolepiota fuliginosa MF-IS2 TaxID=1400762 RepID=A0A9P6BYV7_9AGAR|nr:WD40 repeat-like protein [Macrolepiota fuliginosa MF-IS2]
MCTYGRNTLVTGSTDRTVRIWNLSTGVCTHVLRGHEATVRCLGIARPEVSDDGKEKQPGRPLIVSGSRDGTLRVWTLPKPGEESNRLEGTGPEESIGSSNESPYLRLLLSGHTSAIRALDVKGRTVVTGSYDTTVRVWDIVTGECKFVFSGHTQKVYAVVLDLDNQCVFSGSMDTTIRQWSLESGECLNVLDGHTSLVALLSLSPQYLVSGSADGTARVWDRSTGVSIHELSGASAQAGAITTVYHDDKKVISGCQGAVRNLLGYSHYLGVWAVACRGQWCVAATHVPSMDSNISVNIWDFGTGEDDSVPQGDGDSDICDWDE